VRHFIFIAPKNADSPEKQGQIGWLNATSRMWLALPVWAGPELTCKVVTFDHDYGYVLFLPFDHQGCQRFVALVAGQKTPQWDISMMSLRAAQTSHAVLWRCRSVTTGIRLPPIA
jgi:hypothetical protein